MNVHQLFADLGVKIDGPDVEVRSLVYDSRRVAAGACFASLPGARADGHQYIPQALQKGATSILCEKPVDVGSATRVLSDDARATLAEAARRFFADPASRLTMVGVTGTKGKTTSTHLMAAVLDAAGLSCGLIGTLGLRFRGDYVTTGLTTPESLDLLQALTDMLRDGAKAVCMEVSSHALVQHRVSGVDYDVGVFTNLTHDHLDFHGDMLSYFAAKAQLFEKRLKRGGKAVVNLDDSWGRKLALPGVLTFSAVGQKADVRVVKQNLGAEGTELELETPRGRLTITSPLVARFNVENLLAAVSVGEALGLPQAAIVKGLAGCPAVPGRLEKIASEPLVVVDYAHAPDPLEKALLAMREITRGRLFCVFGCGGDRDAKKRPIMGGIATRLADFTIVTNDNPRSEDPATIAKAIEGGISGGQYVVELDRARAIERAISEAGREDAVLIAGKGHETYQIVGNETRHFDDREVARAVITARQTARGGGVR